MNNKFLSGTIQPALYWSDNACTTESKNNCVNVNRAREDRSRKIARASRERGYEREESFAVFVYLPMRVRYRHSQNRPSTNTRSLPKTSKRNSRPKRRSKRRSGNRRGFDTRRELQRRVERAVRKVCGPGRRREYNCDKFGCGSEE